MKQLLTLLLITSIGSNAYSFCCYSKEKTKSTKKLARSSQKLVISGDKDCYELYKLRAVLLNQMDGYTISNLRYSTAPLKKGLLLEIPFPNVLRLNSPWGIATAIGSKIEDIKDIEFKKKPLKYCTHYEVTSVNGVQLPSPEDGQPLELERLKHAAAEHPLATRFGQEVVAPILVPYISQKDVCNLIAEYYVEEVSAEVLSDDTFDS